MSKEALWKVSCLRCSRKFGFDCVVSKIPLNCQCGGFLTLAGNGNVPVVSSNAMINRTITSSDSAVILQDMEQV